MITIRIWHFALIGVAIGISCFSLDRWLSPVRPACTVEMLEAPGELS